jgi:hypothetical protein
MQAALETMKWPASSYLRKSASSKSNSTAKKTGNFLDCGVADALPFFLKKFF